MSGAGAELSQPAARAMADAALPASLRRLADAAMLDLMVQVYARGHRDGEREAMLRVLKMGTTADPTIAEIQIQVAEVFGIDPRDMTSSRRARAVARPRQLAMYLCRQWTQHSLPVIGRHFGGRDHTTVMHAIHTVERLLSEDGDFRLMAERVATAQNAA